MPKINGKNLRLQLDGNTIACAKSCSLSIEQDLPDATCKDSAGWAEHINGLKSWSLEVTALLDFASTVGLVDLGTALIAGTSFTALFTTGTSTNYEWTGTVDPSSLSVTANNEEAVEYSGSLKGTGALTQQVIA